jgi:hypothetical protein
MNTNPPVCKCLRTKKMFVPEQAAEALSEQTEPGAEAFYWCDRTLNGIGADDRPAHLRTCIPGRSCFEE